MHLVKYTWLSALSEISNNATFNFGVKNLMMETGLTRLNFVDHSRKKR